MAQDKKPHDWVVLGPVVEPCCSSWLTDLEVVRHFKGTMQQLSINPQKLAGQCGKLKCCLNYELDGYMEGIKEFPQ